ncbi:MAG: hypothetical protein QM756_08560 [Polyangiaceae bacterium]
MILEAARGKYRGAAALVAKLQELEIAGATCVGGHEDKGEIREPPLPGVFSWPPPQPTARRALPLAQVAGGASTLGAAAEALQRTLDRAEIFEQAFFRLPDGGFALATRPQAFADDGKSGADPLAERNIPSYLSFEYFRRLLRGRVGRYRVWLIAITGDFKASDATAPAKAIQGWGAGGMPVLPSLIAGQPLKPDWHCVIFLYELYQPSAEAEAQVLGGDAKQGSGLSLQQHLAGAGLTFGIAPAQSGG